jgi:NACHT domain
MEAVRLVIASPSDLRPERELLAETIIPDLNKTVARAKGIVLEDYRWETDTTPGFHPQGWQGKIDQQLRITDAHFLVVMFWKRFGSPIQGGSEAGTEHELRIAFEAWLQSKTFPRILVYFKEEPFYAASVEEAEQFARVRRFRDQFREGGPYELGSYATFSDKLDFERKIRLHLTQEVLPWAEPRKGKDFDDALYRRMACVTEQWRPAGPAPPGRPIHVTLEEMYQEIRLSRTSTDEGVPFTPEEIASQPGTRFVLEGPAGCGKTTWLRRTFERLLRDAPDRFPIFLELRALAAHTHLAVESLIHRAFEDRGYPTDGLADALTSIDAPAPVLLVDGWDELDADGDRFRENLFAYLEKHTQASAIVTTRPTADSKPSTYQHFTRRFFQPLNKEEQKQFARRFWEKYFGTESDWERGYQGFVDAWSRSEEIQDLGGNPMQLSMMLVISRHESLPDRRHRLYDVCVNHLLSRRDKAGPGEWRPDDEFERRRAVAALASGLQSHRNKDSKESGIVCLPSEVEALLPPVILRRGEFVRWLANRTGLLRDRSDGKLQFAHLSYQDHAAARHFLFDQTPPAEIALRTDKGWWWESLRLWAGLAHDEQPKTLAEGLPGLHSSLRGCIFADGAGSAAAFEEWLAAYIRECEEGLPINWEYCAATWKSSRQEARRSAVSLAVDAATSEETGWFAWLRLNEWKQAAFDASPPLSKSLTPILLAQNEPRNQAAFALGRVWSFANPLWPADHGDARLLNAWPCRRRVIGAFLQLMAAIGFSDDELRCAASSALRNSLVQDDWERDTARAVAAALTSTRRWAWGPEAARNMGRDWARYLARYLPRGWTSSLVEALSRGVGGHLGLYLPKLWNTHWARNWTRYLAQNKLTTLAGELASDWGLVDSPAPRVDQLAVALFCGSNVATVRTVLAEQAKYRRGAVALIGVACQQSLAGTPGPLPIDNEIQEPLWPALARHLSRQSTEEDRQLLNHLACHPKERNRAFGWGLKYTVGGTIRHLDGREVPFDKLVPGLSYLDEMELEIDFD